MGTNEDFTRVILVYRGEYDTVTPYNQFDYVSTENASGRIEWYFCKLSYPEGVTPADIELTDTNYWVKSAESGSAGGANIDAVVTQDGQLVTIHGTTAEPLSIPTGGSFGIASDGTVDTMTRLVVDGTGIGFGLLPQQSTVNPIGYVSPAVYDVTEGQQNLPMEMAVDKAGYLVSSMKSANNNGQTSLWEHGYYNRIRTAFLSDPSDFTGQLNAATWLVSQVSAFAGRYLIRYTNGELCSRNHGVEADHSDLSNDKTQLMHDLYANDWMPGFADHLLDVTTHADISEHIIWGFEQDNGLILVMSQMSASYYLTLYRYHSDGTTSQIGHANIGAVRPTQFGFVHYGDPNYNTGTPLLFTVHRHDNGDSTFENRITVRSSSLPSLNVFGIQPIGGSTTQPYVVGDRVYPGRNNRFFYSIEGNSNLLEVDENSHAVQTTIAVPNGISSYQDINNGRYGIIMFYDNTIIAMGDNISGELGIGVDAGTSVAENTTLRTIWTKLPGDTSTNRDFKGAMPLVMTHSAMWLLWSDTELWMAGLDDTNSTFVRTGKIWKNEFNQLPADQTHSGSNRFRRIFITGNSIEQVYCHNQSNQYPNRPMICIRLQNGLVYGTGGYIPENIPWKTPNDGIALNLNANNTVNDPLDTANIQWRLVAI